MNLVAFVLLLHAVSEVSDLTEMPEESRIGVRHVTNCWYIGGITVGHKLWICRK
jgi:hypothetical protein